MIEFLFYFGFYAFSEKVIQFDMSKCGFYFMMSRYMCSDHNDTLDRDFCFNTALFKKVLENIGILSYG